MSHKIALHEGVIRPSLVTELEAFRVPDGRVSTYYLDLDPQNRGGRDGARIAVQDAMARAREQIDGMNPPHAVRKALHADMEAVEAAAAALMLTGCRTSSRGSRPSRRSRGWSSRRRSRSGSSITRCAGGS